MLLYKTRNRFKPSISLPFLLIEMAPLPKIALLLVVAAGTFASDYPCPISGGRELQCSDKELSTVPPGYWPQITRLELRGNTIPELPKNSLTGFPALQTLDLSTNNLEKIEFEEFATIPNLYTLYIDNNQIDTLIPPEEGTILEKIQTIVAFENKITQLDPDFFLFAPNLAFLNVRENPLVVLPGKPVLNHPNLDSLLMGGAGTTLNAVDASLLSGLPKLHTVWLWNAGVTSVDGAFVNHKLLRNVALIENDITQITAGTFPSEGLIQEIALQKNPLKRLDTAAVNKAMVQGGDLNIWDTPLACECTFEALFWWAQTKDISIYAPCSNQPACSFTRRLVH